MTTYRSPCSLDAFRAILYLSSGVAIGCGAPVDGGASDGRGEEEIAVTSQALNGQVTFSGCLPKEETALRAAMNLIVFQVGWQPNAVEDCMKRGFFSGDDGNRPQGEVTYPEMVLRKFLEPRSTVIQCISGQSTNAPPETALISRAEIANNALLPDGSQYLAALIAHEVAHTKGYAHPGPGSSREQIYSVPVQLGQCIYSLSLPSGTSDRNGTAAQSPLGSLRNTVGLSQELTLMQVGQTGGTPQPQRECGSSDFVKGLRGTYTDRVKSLGLVCEASPGSGTHYLTTPQGSTSGTAYDLRCFPGETVVGAHGRATNFINAIGPTCANNADIRNGSLADFGDDPAAVGGADGLVWRRRCPKFHALKAVRLRTGNAVDRVELVCQDIRSPRKISMSTLSAVAGTGGTVEYMEVCPGRSALDRIFVVTSSADGINRLGGECTHVAGTGSGTLTDIATGPRHKEYLVPFHGGGSYDAFAGEHSSGMVECAGLSGSGTNSLLVGLQIGANGTIRSIRGLCADDAMAWSAGTSTVRYLTLRLGDATGPTETRLCPARQFLVGWKTKASEGIDSIAPICRSF